MNVSYLHEDMYAVQKKRQDPKLAENFNNTFKISICKVVHAYQHTSK